MNGQDTLREELLATVQSFKKIEEPKEEAGKVEEKEPKKEQAEEKKEDLTEEVEAESTEETTEEEPKEEDEEPKDEEAEDEEKDSDDKGSDLNKQLSGQPKEFRDAVKSIKDPEAQAQVINAGKLLRAREDQVRLELGNTKKEMVNLKAFDDAFKKDPIQTLKDLAKFAKVDLNSLAAPVQDEYDYRTPEEIAKDDKLKNIESELNQLKNSKQQELNELINQEIDTFADSQDQDGDLKYPHFEKLEDEIFDILAIINQKQGFPTNAKERRERLAMAYKKAELMDDDLVAQRDIEITRKAEEKRKKELEKAKRLKKFSGRTSSVNVKPANDRAELLELVKNSGINW